MNPHPLYLPGKACPAYQLRYVWTGWPHDVGLCNLSDDLLREIKPLWDNDGLRLLEHHATTNSIQLLFSAKPDVSPVFLAARAKGRLDHALRIRGLPIEFSRKFALRAIGDTTAADIEAYIAKQVTKEHFVDSRFASTLQPYTHSFADVDANQSIEATRGRYWYNLHIVLVHAERFRICDRDRIQLTHDRCIAIAAKKAHQLAAISVMPDHLHLSLIGDVKLSPETIVLAYQNNLAYALGQALASLSRAVKQTR